MDECSIPEGRYYYYHLYFIEGKLRYKDLKSLTYYTTIKQCAEDPSSGSMALETLLFNVMSQSQFQQPSPVNKQFSIRGKGHMWGHFNPQFFKTPHKSL